MAGARRSAVRRIGALLLVALAWPGTALAADGDEVATLPGFTALAHVADLDGDGESELVRLVSERQWGPVALEAWSREGSAWRATARLSISGVSADAPAGLVTPDQPATFLRWRDGEGERVLLVTSDGLRHEGGVDRFGIAAVTRSGTRLELTPMPADDEGPAARLQAADLDGDGIDELVVTEPEAWQRSIRVLRWNGDRFVSERISMTAGEILGEPVIGESDGIPGEDLILGRHDRPELVRVTLHSSLTVERVQLAGDSPSRPAWPIAVADGAIFVHVESSLIPALLRVEWPAGAEPDISDVQSDEAGIIFPEPFQVDDELVFFDAPWWYGRLSDPLRDVVVRDRTLTTIATVPVSPALDRTQRWREMAGQRGGLASFPYRGPLPGGIDGSPALIVGGHLLILRDAGAEVRPIAGFAGVAPLGFIGPDDAWMALSANTAFSSGSGYLHPSAPVENGVTIAAARRVLEPEANDGALDVTLVGATPVAGPDGEWLASPDGGFEVVVRGEPGSHVVAIIGTRVQASADIGPEGSTVLRLDPRPRRSDTVPYTLGLVLFAPTGHVYGTDWLGRVLRETTTLDVSAGTRDGALEATIAGRSDPYASVTVDGRPVTTDADGQFRLAVDAGLVPRDVVVRAVDPVGNVATARLEVVGLVDYRPWPWPVIVSVALALFAVGMYLRAPRGPGMRTVARGDGSIEEIEAR